tara:strand:+ start:527 stop:874 length:348 start_codon:yes stop_codon:yes gene_type:complete
MNYWKCLNCEDIQSYSGLCRACTTYDGSQKIMDPIRRVKVDKNGEEIISIPRRFESQNMAQLKQQFISQRSRKPTNKEVAKRKREKELLKELESLKETPNEEGVIEIGESTIEEE